MKPLIISIAAVAAATLWFSEAEARESRHQSNSRYTHQYSHSAGHGSHDYGRRYGHQQQERQQWNRHGDSGRQWGQSHRDNGRHLGHSRHDERRFGDRGRDDRNRFAHNGYSSHNVNQAQWNQRERIQHNSRDGDLTRSERRSLWGEQRAIAAKEREYRSDGQFTRVERKDIASDLKLASRHIYNESHDAERRQHR